MLTLPQEMIDLLDLEMRNPVQSEYGFKGLYPVLETHLMWYNAADCQWRVAEKVKVSKNLAGWYYYGMLPMNHTAEMAQHIIRLKHQIDDASLYIKETKIKNKLKKIKEDFQ